MKTFIKRSILFIIIIILLIALVIFGYLAFVDIKASNAKNYLVERYGLNEKDLLVIKSVEYVYDDITNCESLWLKKCTNDEKLHYEHTFRLKDGTKIFVTEDIDKKYTDDYNGVVVKDIYATEDELNKPNTEKEE